MLHCIIGFIQLSMVSVIILSDHHKHAGYIAILYIYIAPALTCLKVHELREVELATTALTKLETTPSI